jgi:hypothetical protein
MTVRPAPSQRDLRIDVFRGVALLMIFVNHVPGNVFEKLTSRNFGFSDAAEIFVFIAGYASALAYAGDFLDGRFATAVRRVLRRCRSLYLAHIAGVAAAIVIIAAAAWQVNDPTYYEWINLAPVFHNTVAAVIGMLALTHQPGYFNILPLYLVLLASLPLVFWGLRRSIGLTLLASLLLWLVANLFRINLPHYPNTDSWSFNPLAWQLLFVLGVVCGHWARRGETIVRFHPVLFAAATGYVMLGLWSVRTGSWLHWDLGVLDFLIAWNKSYLPFARLLHFLALAYVVLCLFRKPALYASHLCRPLLVLGQNGLPVFCLGSVVAVGAQVLRFEGDGSIMTDALLIGCGIFLQLALAEYLTWRKRRAILTASPAAVAQAR